MCVVRRSGRPCGHHLTVPTSLSAMYENPAVSRSATASPSVECYCAPRALTQSVAVSDTVHATSAGQSSKPVTSDGEGAGGGGVVVGV